MDEHTELASIRRLLTILVVLAVAAGGWFLMHSADTNAQARAERKVAELNLR